MNVKLFAYLAIAVLAAILSLSQTGEAAGQADKWKSKEDCAQVGRFLCRSCCKTFGGEGRMKKIQEHRVQTQCQCA